MSNPIKALMTHAVVAYVLNMNNAKIISLIIVFCVFVIQSIQYADNVSSISCNRLLHGGHLVEKSEGVWAAGGCMLHKYKAQEIDQCLKNENIAFVGDSRIRQLFYSFSKTVFPDETLPEGKIHSNIYLENKEKSIYVTFYWLPELNKTDVNNLYQSWLKDSKLIPTYMFQAAATHTIKRLNGSLVGQEEYQHGLVNLFAAMKQLSQEKQTQMYWLMQGPVLEDVFLEPRKMITNEQVDAYNYIASRLLTKNNFSFINYMDATRRIEQYYYKESEDGLHVPDIALEIESSILINLICNKKIRPIDGSCCQSAPPFTALQVLFALFTACSIVLFIGLKMLQPSTPHYTAVNGTDVESAPKEPPKVKEDPLRELSAAVMKMALILMYFYICDRTNILMKANKHFTLMRFFIPLIYVCVLGLFGMEASKQTSFLNRDQTDEWKGWMQLVILIYHMSGASVNVPIYMNIRLLVAMYLFMTGYGHFAYFWNKGDYSFYRLVNVLFRLNFLTVCLCYVMDRPYQFYYFVPLCTFWFLLLYIFMAAWPRAHVQNQKTQQPTANGTVVQNGGPVKPAEVSSNPRSIFCIINIKLLLLFLFITFILISQSVFTTLFSWWPAIRWFEFPEGSVREWWFRCQLDRYAMLHGAIFSFIYIMLKRMTLIDDLKQGCLMSMKLSVISVGASIAVLVTYTIWMMHCTSKPACNSIHALASFVPITGFILIRNIPGYLRSGYSAFFAWFGKISLELFIGQYHIWLAADTKGVLLFFAPNFPTLNLVFTTLVFVSIAHEINSLTGIFAKHFLGTPKDSSKRLLFKVIILSIVLIFLSVIDHTYSHKFIA